MCKQKLIGNIAGDLPINRTYEHLVQLSNGRKSYTMPMSINF